MEKEYNIAIKHTGKEGGYCQICASQECYKK